MREPLSLWLEYYTGDGWNHPETFEDKAVSEIEEEVTEYFTEGVTDQWIEELGDSDDFMMFRIDLAEMILDQIKEKTGQEALDETQVTARLILKQQEIKQQQEKELLKHQTALVRKFQEEHLPWMLDQTYIDRPTWKKLGYSDKLKEKLKLADDEIKQAILRVGLTSFCSRSVSLDINKLVHNEFETS